MNKKVLLGVLTSAFILGGCAGESRIEPIEREKISVKSFSSQVKDFDDIEKTLNETLSDCEIEHYIKRHSEFVLSISFDDGHNFDVQNEDVNQHLNKTLRDIADDLKPYENVQVYVNGHSDSSGIKEINYSLSKQRAKNAANVLVGQGMKSYQVIYDEFAGEHGVAKNDYQHERQKNRRIELTITNVYVEIPDNLKGRPRN